MEVNLSGTADLLIRLKYVFKTYLGLFMFKLKYMIHEEETIMKNQ